VRHKSSVSWSNSAGCCLQHDIGEGPADIGTDPRRSFTGLTLQRSSSRGPFQNGIKPPDALPPIPRIGQLFTWLHKFAQGLDHNVASGLRKNGIEKRSTPARFLTR